MAFCQKSCGRKCSPGRRYCRQCFERMWDKRANKRRSWREHDPFFQRQRNDNVGFANAGQTIKFERE
jgi:hypothetical protein